MNASLGEQIAKKYGHEILTHRDLEIETKRKLREALKELASVKIENERLRTLAGRLEIGTK